MENKFVGHILVIDDNPEMRDLLTSSLQLDNHLVSSFSNPKQALEFIKKSKTNQIHVVVSDIHMPQMSGIEFAMKAREIFPDLPVILTTAYGSINNAIEAMKRGAFDYLTKPFKISDLQQMVQKALAASKAHAYEGDLKSQIVKNFLIDPADYLPTIDQLEKKYIQLVLEKTGGKKDKASIILGINRRTLYRKEREYDLTADLSSPEPEPDTES